MALSRRRFLQVTAAAGGGLAVGFPMPLQARGEEDVPHRINAWLTIGTDGTVTVTCHHSEMGQGVTTALPMLVAEELDVPWQDVRFEMAPAMEGQYSNRMFGSMSTGGSTSVRESFYYLQSAGTAARMLLERAAAQIWGVDAATCQGRQGRVVHAPSGRSLEYGALAAEASRLDPPSEVYLKEAKARTLIGRPVPRLDVAEKVTGKARFGIDVVVPDMLVGTVAQAPVIGAGLKRLDPAPAYAIEGVREVIQLPGAAVVLADDYWTAKKGLDALQPEWHETAPNASFDSAEFATRLAKAAADGGVDLEVKRHPKEALRTAAKVVTADYAVPFLAHATMEPMNATARVEQNRVDMWLPTQSQSGVVHGVSRALGIDPGKVKVHTTYLGGGFGRRSEWDFAVLAALASKKAKRPVKLIWSREEDTTHDWYRPMASARFAGGLDDDGNLVAWENVVASPSILRQKRPSAVRGGIDRSSMEGAHRLPYDIPHQRIAYALVDMRVPLGWWRSVGHSVNGFFVESFVDEMAHAAGADPVAFRLKLLGNKSPRHAAVLERAAEKAGWSKAAPPGRFRGVSLHESFGSIVAEVAEVSMQDGKVGLHRVTCVVDCGTVVNPDTVEAQMESGIVYALTAALYGEVPFKAGQAQVTNFHDYPMVRLARSPAVDVHIIESGADIGGIGEPATPPLFAALTNAIFAATGKRVRSLPLSQHGLA